MRKARANPPTTDPTTNVSPRPRRSSINLTPLKFPRLGQGGDRPAVFPRLRGWQLSFVYNAPPPASRKLHSKPEAVSSARLERAVYATCQRRAMRLRGHRKL